MLSTVGSLDRAPFQSVAVGFISSAVLVLCFFVPRLLHQGPTFGVFERVKLTMPRTQAETLLRSGGAICRWASADSICEFSDFWREYRIVMSSQTGTVVRKSFAFKHSRFIRR
jgi:hypothetical protein